MSCDLRLAHAAEVREDQDSPLLHRELSDGVEDEAAVGH